jgi:hypothetical protein
LKEKKCFK